MDSGYALRPVAEDEWLDFGRAMSRVFHEVVTEEDVPRWRAVAPLGRFLAVEAPDGDLVGTGGVTPLPMSMPGAEPVACAGVTAITVRPDHRRRGLLTAMMQRLLDEAWEAGEPLAALFASEGRIYGRYGFGPAAPQQGLQVERATLESIDGRPSLVEVVDAAAAKRAFPPIMAAHARQRGGMLQRSAAWYDLWLDHERARDDEGHAARWHVVVPDRGYAVFRVRDGDWANRRPGGRLRVSELVSTDPEATAALWSFLGTVDLVTTISAPARPPDDPLPHLVAAESEVDTAAGMSLWVRLVDLPAALTARGYEVEDRVVLEVSDDQLPVNAGRWVLDAGPDGATCERTDAAPDLAVSTSLLATMYLGGVRATRLADAGRLPGAEPSLVRRLDRLFDVARAPWQPFDF